jgi:hypothetical protein
MLAHHRDLAITDDQRFRFASLTSLAADDADLPADPEFRAALVGYLEWGTRLAMHNSQPGADVVQQAPVPRWGLGRRSALSALTRPASRGATRRANRRADLAQLSAASRSSRASRLCALTTASQKGHAAAMPPTSGR